MKPQVGSAKRAAVFLQGGKAVEFPLVLVLSVLLARFLGPQEFATYSVAIAVAGIATVAVSFGGEELAQRQLGMRKYASASHVTTPYLAQRGALLIVAAGLAVAVWFCFPFMALELLILIIVFVAVNCGSNLLAAFANGLYRSSVPSLASAAGTASTVGLVFFGRPSTASAALALQAICLIVKFVVVAVWAHRARIYSLRLHQLPSFQASLRTHAQVGFSNVLILILGRQSDIIIGKFLNAPAEEIASYAVAFSMVVALNTVLLMGLGPIGLTMLSNGFAQGSSELGVRWTELLKLTAFLAAAPLGVAVFGSSSLAGALFNVEQYPSLPTYFVVLGTATWLGRLIGGGTNTASVIVLGRERDLFLLTLAGGTLNLAGSFILIPRFGMLGAALATGAASSVTGYWLGVITKRRTGGKWPLKYYVKLTLCTGFAGLAFVLGTTGPIGFVVEGAVYVALWSLLVWVLGLIPRHLLDAARSVATRVYRVRDRRRLSC